jgi:hydroxyethylthiazole kinase-like uncharacterized protein yjeF
VPRSIEHVDARFLHDWPLPEPGESKHARGDVLAVGGARRSPGALLLAGEAALRVGAGRLTLAVGASVADHIAVAMPESGVVALEEDDDSVAGRSAAALEKDAADADAVLVGPGLDDADSTLELLEGILPMLKQTTAVVLDAYALGVLTRLTDGVPRGRTVLTPNSDEAGRILGREIEDLESDLLEVAESTGAVLSSMGIVAAPGDRVWRVGIGGRGLATSGSGDVLAGILTGLLARGATPEQAAVWATYLHVEAGNSAARDIAPLGYLARELLPPLPGLMAALSAG